MSSSPRLLYSQTERAETVKIAAHAVPSISLVVNGSSDGQGRVTTLSQGVVDFGNVIFVRPDLIKNGDAWHTPDFKLKLAATFNLQTIFGGLRNVAIAVTREGITEEPFYGVYYSTGVFRSDQEIAIPFSPTENTIRNLESGESVRLRLIAVLDSKQKGRVSDKIKLKVKGEEF